MHKFLGFLAVSAAFAGLAAPAQAAVVLSDSFDSEASGATILNYGTATGSFANFTVGDGTVDLIGPGNIYGIGCVTGSCVDLDGSAPNDGGTLTTRLSYAYNAGDRVTLKIQLSGNQRGGAADEFSFGFNTDVATNFLNVVQENTAFPGTVVIGDLGPGMFLGSGRPFGANPLVASNEPFTLYSISFTAGNSGNLTAFVGTASADNVGPILDNFELSIGAVPEPATWAMMIAGFGLTGVAMRRRKTAVSFA